VSAIFTVVQEAPAALPSGSRAGVLRPEPAAGATAGGPLAQILLAFTDTPPCRSVREICHRTGLPRDLVDAALDHLVRTGRLKAESLASGCPEGACGGCAARHGCPVATLGRARSLTLV